MTDKTRELESLHKEIDLIQGCISRMAQNSFLIKGWAIGIISVTWALLLRAGLSQTPMIILLIPILGFWYLDAYYLRAERQYRQLYEWVLDKHLKESQTILLYQLNLSLFKEQIDFKKSGSVLDVMFSRSVFPFYGLLLAIVIVSGCDLIHFITALRFIY